MSAEKLAILLQNPNLDPELKQIAQKVAQGERINFEEGVILYEKGELSYLGVLANYIREKRHGNRPISTGISILSLPIYVCTIANFARIHAC